MNSLQKRMNSLTIFAIRCASVTLSTNIITSSSTTSNFGNRFPINCSMRWYNSTSYLEGKNSFQNITFQLVASHHQVESSMVTPSQKQLVTGLTKTLCCPKNPDTIPLSQSWQKQYTQFLEWSVYCFVFIKILQNNQNF